MMGLDEKKQKHLDFWSGKRKNIVSIQGGPQSDYPYQSLQEKWLDPAYRIKQADFDYQNQWYGTDCVPSVFVNFGPGILSACMGGHYELLEKTICFDKKPIIQDYSNLLDLKFHQDSEIWKLIKETYERLLDNSCGRYIVSVTDWGGIMDVFCGLRGTMDVLSDLYDYPNEIKSLTQILFHEWLIASKEDQKIFENQGFTHWIPIYSDKVYQTIQCDFSAMMSNAMFHEFVLPTLKKQTENLYHSIYHLDGEEAEKHLDSILTLDQLDGIQYVPSDFNHNNPGDPHHFPLYERILAGGKKLFLIGVCADLLEGVLKAFSDQNIFVTCTVPTVEQAKSMDDIVDKYRK